MLEYCAAEVEVEHWLGIGPVTVAEGSEKPSLVDLSTELALVSSESQAEESGHVWVAPWAGSKRSHWCSD